MRTSVACFVLAALIATPGIVVAAMSSEGHGTASSGKLTYRAEVAPVRSTPIDPALRPAVDAVTRAFAANGIKLLVEPYGPGSAEAFNVSASGGCPTFILFHDERKGLSAFSSGCPAAKILVGQIKITYGPPSIGATIKRAMAGLR